MLYSNVELTVLVKNREITEHAHNGKLFLEGRPGSKFTIRVKNNNSFKIEAILSVDGLSVIDGKDASDDSKGYLVDSYSHVDIPGWTLDNNSVAAFEFAGKGQSYAQAATGSTRNVGVIGLMVYKEKIKSYSYSNSITQAQLQTVSSAYNAPIVGSGWSSAGAHRGIDSTNLSAQTFNAFGGADTTIGCAKTSADAMYVCATSSLQSNTTNANAFNATETSVNNLGTAFGEKTNFNTRTESFERGDLLAMIVLFYDDKRGLAQRGIDVSPKKVKAPSEPNPFPGSYCKPPKGWRV